MAGADRCWTQAPEALCGSSVRIATFNMLADCAAIPAEMPHVSVEWLSWSDRCTRLKKEMERADADIYCLQEVDMLWYETVWNKYFQARGFASCFECRHHHGLCIAYREQRMSEISKEIVSFDDVCEYANSSPSRNTGKTSPVRTGRIGLMMIFEGNDPASTFRLAVITTHLYLTSKQPCEHIQHQQVQALSEMAAKAVPQAEIGTVLCGDFNSTCVSNVYAYLLNERFCSAYKEVLGEEPSVCRWTDQPEAVVDFLFYSPSLLRATAVLDVPQISNDIRKPNRHFGSDHVLLAADFVVQVNR